jgi:hypothetical protein
LEQGYAPLLPDGWRSLTLQDITFRGRHYDIVVARDPNGRVQLTRHPRS